MSFFSLWKPIFIGSGLFCLELYFCDFRRGEKLGKLEEIRECRRNVYFYSGIKRKKRNGDARGELRRSQRAYKGHINRGLARESPTNPWTKSFT